MGALLLSVLLVSQAPDGLSLLADGRVDEAIPLLEDAHDSDPADTVIAKYLGIALFLSHRDREAAEILGGIDGADSETTRYLGASLYRVGELDEASAILGHMVSIHPDDEFSRYYLNLVEEDMRSDEVNLLVEEAERARFEGNLEDSLDLYRRALAIDSSSASINFRVDELERAIMRREAENLFRRGIEEGDRRLFREAVPLFRDLIARGEINLEYDYGISLLRTAEDDLERSDLEGAAAGLSALDSIPGGFFAAGRSGGEVELLRARLAAAGGDYLTAGEAYRRAEEAWPGIVPTLEYASFVLKRYLYYLLIVLLLAAAGAFAIYRKRESLIPSLHRRYLREKARRAEAGGDLHAFIESAEALLALDNSPPYDPDLPLRLAAALARVGRRRNAIRRYREILEERPGNMTALRGLFDLSGAPEEMDHALHAGRMIIDSEAPSEEKMKVVLSLGERLVRLGRAAEAIDLLSGLSGTPARTDPELLFIEADARKALGDNSAAELIIKGIIRSRPDLIGPVLERYGIPDISPGERHLHRILADHFESIGDPAKAEEELSAAAGDSPERRDILPDLARLRKAIGDSEGYRAALAEYLVLSPSDLDKRIEYAEALLDAGSPLEAGNALLPFFDRGSLEAFRLLEKTATLLAGLGLKEEASEILAALSDTTDFDDTNIHFSLASLLEESGDLKGAVTEIQKIEHGGTAVLTRARTFAASCWRKMGSAGIARDILDALDLSRPGITERIAKAVWYERALVAEALGDRIGGLRAYDEILKLDINYRDVSSRRDALLSSGGDPLLSSGKDSLLPSGDGNVSPIRCPSCGASRSPGDRFCSACGASLPGNEA